MVKKIFIMVLLFPFLMNAQETRNGIADKGLLRASGTISFGSMTKQKQTNIYLHGVLEYYLTKNISSRGDVYYYLKSGDQQLLNLNHQLFAGASYHFNTNNNFDPYLGIEPGIGLTQANYVVVNVENNTEASPLISAVVGFNYYASKWFHLFIDGRYVTGKHLSNQKMISLNELRLSFGLGINLNVLKKKNKDSKLD